MSTQENAQAHGGKVFATCDFADLVKQGYITEYDGIGYYCRDDVIPVVENGCRKTVVLNDPDDIRDSEYPWIMWFNR